MRSSLLCRAAIALPVFITAAVLAASAASVTACALWIDGDAGVAAMTVTAVVAVAVWRSGVRIWTRPRDHRSVHGVPLPDDSPVSELVAIESARLPLALAEVCATLGSGVQVDRGVLEIGIGALAAASEVELRIEIAASLQRHADRLRAVAARTRAALIDPGFPRAWRPVMAASRRLLVRALAEREALVVGAVSRAHGPDAERQLVAARERNRAYDAYWDTFVSPTLADGFRPPISDGWRRYMGEGDRGPSHLAASEEDLERRLLEAAAAAEARELVPISWERFAEAVMVPALERDRAHIELPSATIGDLASLVDELGLADLPLAGGESEPPTADAALLAHHASIPGGAPEEPTVLALHDPPGLRRRVAIAVCAGLAVGLPTVALLGWEAATLDATVLARASVGTMGLGLAALLIRWTTSRVRAAWSTGTLTLSGDRVVLDHPGLLREPWELDGARLTSVVVDEGDGAATAARFPFGESAWDGPGSAGHRGGFLWDEHDSFAAVLGAPGQMPNVALLFDPPASAPRVRRVQARGPLPGEAVGALLLAVRAIGDAESGLRERGLLRPLSSEDVRRLLAIFNGR